MTQGKLIVFEGGEGAGKTTQMRRLQDYLLGHDWGQSGLQRLGDVPVVVTREPGGTELGECLRGLLLGTEGELTQPITDTAELLMYAADRAQHVLGVIRPHLERGQIVLCDRYTASTVAYQGYGRGLDLNLIEQLNQIATGGLRSDLTLWLDVPVTVGLARVRQRSSGGGFDRMEAGEQAFHERIRAGFAAIANRDQVMIKIDASRDIERVATQIQDVVNQRLMQWYPSRLLN